MKDINFIDSCQAILPLARSDIGAVIDSERHLIRMCKTSLLFAPSAGPVHTGCSTFLFYTPTKLLIYLHIEN